ncbi:hypothetical protein QBC36DRAFT_184160 [Triangularia setosa]|uniref:Uncharacterized protein n=1 Tax=Triangularia setosa TaxID=2587417 RepID=A0AAN6WB20_9PEZI|nr:hypothetical protein QBC36DRAFT_184160 [Podospora setosa]
MYKTRIKSWGLDKNFKECEVVELFRLRNERDRVGKRSTTYMIRGREVDWDRVQNYVRRKGLNITQLLASSSGIVSPCTREISCYTPPPEDGRPLTTRASQQSLVDVNLLRVSSPSSSSPSPSPPNSSSNHLVSTAPIFAPISTAPSTTLPPHLPMLLDQTIMNNPMRRPSYSFPPPHPLPMLTPPPPALPALHPPPPPQYTPSPLAGPGSTLQNFQLFLTRLYKTTMFQDGERAWGTTDFFLRNMRSLEWLSTIRYSLAINKKYLASPGNNNSPEIQQFKAINRAFAILEPTSKGVIGSRMFYIVNFLGSFYSDPENDEKGKGPLTELAVKIMEDIVVKCICGGDTDRESSGFGGDLRRVLGGSENKMEIDSFGADANPNEPRLIDEGASVKETAGRFLIAVLERMLKEVGLQDLPLRVVLLHDLPGKANIDVTLDWTPKEMSGNASSCWKSCLLSPISPSTANKKEDSNGALLLESGIWLAEYGDEVQAEEKFRVLIDGVRGGSNSSQKMAPVEMKVLVRCAHYQLASVYWRRGEKMAAKQELKRSVKESVLYDHFVKWEDVEFLYV